MKWLFAILVVLNIVVFGSMVAGKMIRNNIETTTADTNMAANIPVTSPAEPNISIQPTGITHNETLSAVKPPKSTSKSEHDNNHARHADDKTEGRNKAENKDSNRNNSLMNEPNNSCSATVSIPEDDFHRIKGLFSKWPYTTSRFIEKLNAAKPKNAPTRYFVSLPGMGDSDLRNRLQSQGFDYGIIHGQVSLGLFNRRSDAESLLARAKMHGFSEAEISLMNGNDNNTDSDAATSIAKIRVVFTGINNAAIADINNVVSRYGHLQSSGVCQ